MGKRIIISSFAVLVLLSSCSNDEVEMGAPEITLGNSEVEIQLSTGGYSSRSSIESNPAGLFETDNLGIFCLAKENLGINIHELPIDWFTLGDEETYSVWMNNVESVARINSSSTATNILWTDGMQRWYPTGNWHRYSFYGYYPRQSSVVSTSTTKIVNIPLDGTQDVIYGKTNNESDELAYCAKYFRNAQFQNVTPSLSFEHKLMRLTFSFVAGEDANGSIEPALLMGIVSLKIKDMPSVASLVIADRDNPENDGKIVYDWENNLTDFVLCDDNDEPLSENYWVGEESQNIGEGILVPVSDNPEKRYYIEVVLKDKTGNIFYPEHPMELLNVAGGFHAGNSYHVNMTIHGTQGIELQGTLTPWVNVDNAINDVTY